MQSYLMAANGHGEVWSIGLTFHFNFVQHAAELASGRQNPGDAVKLRKIGMVEGIDSGEWRGAGIVAPPRTEVAVGLYLSRRRWVGEAGDESCGVPQANRVH